MLLGQDAVDRLLDDVGPEHVEALQWLEVAVHANHRRQTRGQVQVRAPGLDERRQGRVEIQREVLLVGQPP